MLKRQLISTLDQFAGKHMKNWVRVLIILMLIQPTFHHDSEDIHETINSAPNAHITDQQKVKALFTGIQDEVGEWLSLPRNKTLERALWQCYVVENSTEILGFYQSLSSAGQDFTKKHVDLLPKLFRKHKHVPNILKCLAYLREFENKFMEEPKKLKLLLQFLRQHPGHANGIFPLHQNYTLKGHKLGYFLKVLFEFYYVEVVSSMETLATSFMRALTLRSQVLEHYDIAYCLSLETLGAMSVALEQISINNIYLKMPDLLRQVRYLKLKEHCKDEENRRLVSNMRQALSGMDMFNIMFNEYEPWVEIATEKFGHTQVRMIARQFAHILDHRQKYLQLSASRKEEISPKQQNKPGSSPEL